MLQTFIDHPFAEWFVGIFKYQDSKLFTV